MTIPLLNYLFIPSPQFLRQLTFGILAEYVQKFRRRFNYSNQSHVNKKHNSNKHVFVESSQILFGEKFFIKVNDFNTTQTNGLAE